MAKMSVLNISTSSNASISPLTSPARKKCKMDSKTTMNKTALGVSSFEELVEESTIFIDKSLLIKDFIDNSAKVLLITCPRRWGKSINMNMIKTFFEIEVDQYGKRLHDKREARSYKLFQGQVIKNNKKSEQLDQPLNIAHENEFIEEYQGEHPVILIDFKNVKGKNYHEIVKKLKLAIYDNFMRNKYLIDWLFNSSTKCESNLSQKKEAENFFKKFQRLYDNPCELLK